MGLQIAKASVWQNSTFVCMARIEGADGALATRDSFSSISVAIIDESAGSITLDETSLSVNSVVPASPMTEHPWPNSHVPGNFKYIVPYTALPNQTTRLAIRFTAVMQDGSRHQFVYRAAVNALPV